MTTTRTPLAAIVATCAFLGLGACGGGDEDNAETAATSTPAAAESTPTTTATEAAGTSGEKTKPGAELAVGETAHVDIKPLSAGTNDKKTYAIDVTVLKIEKGSLDDFKNIDLDPEQKKAMPFYVTVRMTATTEDIPVKDDDPDIRFDGIDDRGQEQGDITFLGTFERCDDKEAPNPLKKGESYESCLTYLIPGGGSIEAVAWKGSDEYILKPVVWK